MGATGTDPICFYRLEIANKRNGVYLCLSNYQRKANSEQQNIPVPQIGSLSSLSTHLAHLVQLAHSWLSLGSFLAHPWLILGSPSTHSWLTFGSLLAHMDHLTHSLSILGSLMVNLAHMAQSADLTNLAHSWLTLGSPLAHPCLTLLILGSLLALPWLTLGSPLAHLAHSANSWLTLGSHGSLGSIGWLGWLDWLDWLGSLLAHPWLTLSSLLAHTWLSPDSHLAHPWLSPGSHLAHPWLTLGSHYSLGSLCSFLAHYWFTWLTLCSFLAHSWLTWLTLLIHGSLGSIGWCNGVRIEDPWLRLRSPLLRHGWRSVFINWLVVNDVISLYYACAGRPTMRAAAGDAAGHVERLRLTAARAGPLAGRASKFK